MRFPGVLIVVGVVLVAGPAWGLVQWTDEAASVGVSSSNAGEVHPPGLTHETWPAFPEILGGGACAADFDGDGYDDLYLVSQAFNPENPETAGWLDDVDPHNQLFLNNGDGTFEDVSAEAGVDARRFGYGCSAADYDGDGFVDLYATAFGDAQWGGNILYRNNGDGTFTDVTEAAGLEMLGACGDYACMSTSSAWADYDADGDLDLYSLNYVETTLTDLGRGPRTHLAQTNWLFRNDGDGTFTEVCDAAGVCGNPTDEEGSKSLGVVWFDYDLDGDVDLYVANDETPNDFYVNNGDGTFTERSVEANLDNSLAGMGLTSGDYDGDGLADLFFTHYRGELNGFYRNRGDGTFEDRSGEDDHANSLDHVGWGTSFRDHDRDGDLDIILVNGHTEWLAPGYRQPVQVFRNDPPLPGDAAYDREWVEISVASGFGPSTDRVHRGAAFGDYDLDGSVDFAVVQNANETAQVFMGSGVENNWLYIRLNQPGMNRFGVGARVTVVAGGVPQVREVQTGTSFLSQNTLTLDFGLGPNAQADSVQVQWPGGATTLLADVSANTLVRIDRSSGAYTDDAIPPHTTIALDGLAGSNGWWRSAVTATLASQDRGLTRTSGVAGTEFNLDGGGWQAYAGPVAGIGEGIHRILGRSTDNDGNTERGRPATIKVDLTPPTPAHTLSGAMGTGGWFVGPSVAVTLTGADALSGVATQAYQIDGGAWTTYAAPFSITGSGVHVLEYYATDAAGNTSPVATAEVRIDSDAPEAAFVRPAPGTAYVGPNAVGTTAAAPAIVVAAAAGAVGNIPFVVRVEATDTVSGVVFTTLRLDGELVAATSGGSLQYTWNTLDERSGVHHLEARATDGAGNGVSSEIQVIVVAATPAGLRRTAEEGPAVYTGLLLLGFAVTGVIENGRSKGRRGRP